MRLHFTQRDARAVGLALQALKRIQVQRERALGEAPLDLQVREVTADVVVQFEGLLRRHGVNRP
jgi:hypothetical protein